MLTAWPLCSGPLQDSVLAASLPCLLQPALKQYLRCSSALYSYTAVFNCGFGSAYIPLYYTEFLGSNPQIDTDMCEIGVLFGIEQFLSGSVK